MSNKISFRFLVGLLFGITVGFVIWYWQKSTSAEDGALVLLDRLASAESKLRKLGEERLGSLEVRSRQEQPLETEAGAFQEHPDEMQQVRGVGPVFAERLRLAGIVTHRKLASTSREKLAGVLGTSSQRAEDILVDARRIIS